jgi:DNA-binding CsgD family transcriptional regulator
LQLPESAVVGEIRARALYVAGVLAWVQTEYPVGRVYLAESVAIWRELPSDAGRGLAFSLVWLGLIHAYPALASGEDCALGSACVAEALAILQRLGDTWGSAFAQLSLGMIANLANDPSAAQAYLEASVVSFSACSDRWWPAISRNHLGRAASSLGDYDRAGTVWRTALPVFLEYGDKHHMAGMLNSFGRLVQPGEDAVRAVQLYGAEEVLRRDAGIPLQSARVAGYQQSIERAKRQLGEVGFAAAWAAGAALSLTQALALAMQPTAGHGPAVAVKQAVVDPRPALSRRQHEVLQLLAMGKSNREIAETLVLSQSAVAFHVTNICTKLGAANRTEAAAYAHRHHLLQDTA